MSAVRRRSKKREAILECIRESTNHPSAEWIYTKLKDEYPDLSLGTVYRNLALFRESGEIVSVATVHGVERFDPITIPHSHFICDQCDAVLNIEVSSEVIRSHLEKRYGCEIRRTEMIFRGLCSRCKHEIVSDTGGEVPKT